MAKYTQEDRPVRIDTPLGPDVLLLTGYTASEGISQLFRVSLDLVSTDPDIAANSLYGKPVTISVRETNDGSGRFINGFVSRFSQGGKRGDLIAYQAEVVPWLWFLSLTCDLHIYQQKTAVEIIEEVFIAHSYHDFEIRCSRTCAKREFCVQYRESHFALVSRLMEEEGIFYFFEHGEGRHVLVLADAPGAIESCPGMPVARLSATATPSEDVITTILHEYAQHVGRITLSDWDPLQPAFGLETSIAGAGPLEHYDYPAEYSRLEVGDHYARVRLEASEAAAHVIRGAGTCRTFESGRRFELTGHFRPDLNREYVLTQVQHRCRAGDFLSDDGASFDYANTFVCIPHDVPFRPRQVTPRPIVRGPQTAIVMGPPGEDIWTDKYGRVKVRFHWDRQDVADEGRSCWVRVASFWAGKGWGALHLPRPGHEVVVEFLEGNPDRPLITGSVYNDANRPAWSLPGDENISGIRSRSAPGGTAERYNEIILDDTADRERVAIHAERSFHLRTEASEHRLIGANSEARIRGARGVIVQGEKQMTFEEVSEEGESAQFQETLGDYLEVHGNRFVVVGKVEQYRAGEGHGIEVVEGDQVILLHVGNQSIVITDAGDQRIQVENGAQIIEVKTGDQQILALNGNHVVNAGDVTLEAKHGLHGRGTLVLTAETNAYVEAEKSVTIEAKERITLRVGDTKLEMTEKGVEIEAPFIVQRALVKAQTLASIVEIAAVLNANIVGAVMTKVVSGGVVKVAGGAVQIN